MKKKLQLELAPLLKHIYHHVVMNKEDFKPTDKNALLELVAVASKIPFRNIDRFVHIARSLFAIRLIHIREGMKEEYTLVVWKSGTVELISPTKNVIPLDAKVMTWSF